MLLLSNNKKTTRTCVDDRNDMYRLHSAHISYQHWSVCAIMTAQYIVNTPTVLDYWINLVEIRYRTFISSAASAERITVPHRCAAQTCWRRRARTIVRLSQTLAVCGFPCSYTFSIHQFVLERRSLCNVPRAQAQFHL